MNTLLLIVMLAQYQIPPYTGNENIYTWQWDQYRNQQEYNRRETDRQLEYLHQLRMEQLLREQNNILRNQLPGQPKNDPYNWRK